MSERRIAVIGAGPMGLAVAYQLALDGHEPVVFEADDRVGGMTATFELEGMVLERFYHFHCVSDDAFLQMLEELGLAEQMRWVETKMAYWFDGQVQPWGNPATLLRFKGLGLVAKLRYGLHVFTSTRRNNWRALDRIEATDWVRRWVGQEAYEKLWRRLFELKFHEYAHDLSAAWIWTRIRRIGRSRYSMMREKLGYVEDGSHTWLTALSSAITERGGQIRLGAPVTRILVERGAVRGLEANGRAEEFDTVISTIPLPRVPDLVPELSDDEEVQLRALNSVSVVCVIAVLRSPLTSNFWLNTSDPEMDIPGLVEYTALRPMDKHVVYVPYYLSAEHSDFEQSDEFFSAKVMNHLRRIQPLLKDGDVTRIVVNRYRFAQPVCTPEYLDALPPAALSIRGLWAVDTSHYYPEDRGVSESIRLGRRIGREVSR